jgi:potassium/chloride transporter 4/5/6
MYPNPKLFQSRGHLQLSLTSVAFVVVIILRTYLCYILKSKWLDGLDRMCVLGKRLLRVAINDCHKNVSGPLHDMFCPNSSLSCDQYYSTHDVSIVNGIKGLSSGVIMDNIYDSFLETGQYLAIGKNPEDIEPMDAGNQQSNQVTSDITTTFTILIGIFFPSVTGIMAGSNRSGDLADAQKSIPVGTICAILTTSTVYLSSVILFAGTVDNLLLRDKLVSATLQLTPYKFDRFQIWCIYRW